MHGSQDDQKSRREETNKLLPHQSKNRSQSLEEVEESSGQNPLSPTKVCTSNREQVKLGESQDLAITAPVQAKKQLAAVNFVATINGRDKASEQPLDCTRCGTQTACTESQPRQPASAQLTYKNLENPSQLLTTRNHAHNSLPQSPQSQPCSINLVPQELNISKPSHALKFPKLPHMPHSSQKSTCSLTTHMHS